MHTGNRLLALTVLTAALTLPASAALADTPDSFGAHVRDCAQSVGLSGDHNPGMHDGASGWDGTPCQ